MTQVLSLLELMAQKSIGYGIAATANSAWLHILSLGCPAHGKNMDRMRHMI